MVQLLAGFQVSQALYAAAKTGIPDQLVAGPRATDEIADALNLDRAATLRLVRDLAGLGVFVSTPDGEYALTPLGRTLTSDDPHSMRDLALMWMETHYAPFGGLVETVRTGECAATTYYGTPFFDWLADRPEHFGRFIGAMANLTDGIKVEAITSYDFRGSRRIADIGGSDGTLLAHVLAQLPDATGISYDLPHVVPSVAVKAKETGLEDRLSGVAGDFFASVPSGYDTYLTSLILHDWDDERATQLLRNIVAAGEPGARVRCVEFVLPEGDAPHMAKMIDLTMLGMLTGRERTEDEFRTLFDAAGLVFERAVSTATPLSIIEARVG
jgi:hypothetical protein